MATDEATGKPFRRMVFASRLDDGNVLLTVTVTAEPRVLRRARRLSALAEFIEGRRGAADGQSFTLLPTADADRPRQTLDRRDGSSGVTP